MGPLGLMKPSSLTVMVRSVFPVDPLGMKIPPDRLSKPPSGAPDQLLLAPRALNW